MTGSAGNGSLANDFDGLQLNATPRAPVTQPAQQWNWSQTAQPPAANPLANFQTGPAAAPANSFANPFITGAPLVAAGGPAEQFGQFASSSIPAAVPNTSSLDGLSWASFGSK